MLEQKFRSFQEMGQNQLQQALGYNFHDSTLLNQALTRRSAINSGIVDKKKGHNESLEFLGDRVLNLIMADIVRAQHRDWSEGQLTTEHSKLVQNATLTGIAKKLNLGNFLVMDNGERINNSGQQNKKILADSLEAIIGAMYQDAERNLRVIGRFVHKHWYALQNALFPMIEQLNKAENGDSTHGQLTSQIIEAIKLGADIRRTDEHNKTIFHYMNYHNSIMEEILEVEKNWSGIDLRGVDEDAFRGYEHATDDVYYQALHFNNMNFRKTNLTGVDLSSRTMSNVSFNDAIAAGTNFSNVVFRNVSFDGNANLLGANFTNCTMDLATRRSYYKAVEEGRANKFEIRIDHNEFWQAVNGNDVELVRECLQNKYKIESSSQATLAELNQTAVGAKDTNGLTALHIAAGKGFEGMVKLLLEYKPDVLAKVQKHRTYNHRDMFSDRYLLATLQMTMKIGSVGIIDATPLDLAQGNGHKNIENMILTYMQREGLQPSQHRIPSAISSQIQDSSNDNEQKRKETLARHGNTNEKLPQSNANTQTKQQGWYSGM